MKAKIDKLQEDSECTMCGKADESISHPLSECSKLSQRVYKRRHDWMGRKIHGRYVGSMVSKRKRNGMNMSHKQYVKMKSTNSCGTFTLQTDNVIEVRRPDMIIVEKKSKKCQIIDFAVPYHTRVDEKVKE